MTDDIHDWNAGPRARRLVRPGVTFLDETLRDGIQCPSVTDPCVEDKIALVHAMNELGIHYVNVGLPAASARNRDDCEAICRDIVASRLAIRPIAAARTMRNDIAPIAEIAQRAGIEVMAYAFIGSSEIRKLVESWDVSLLVEKTRESIEFAARENVPVCYVTEDTTRAHPRSLRTLWHAALDAGASRLCLADTVGHAMRRGVRNLAVFARTVIDEHGRADVGLDWHGHNDRGLALDNALWALEYGIDRIHGTAMGIGERTGNTAMELLLLNLWLAGELELSDPTALERYAEIARNATSFAGRAPAAERPARDLGELTAARARA